MVQIPSDSAVVRDVEVTWLRGKNAHRRCSSCRVNAKCMHGPTFWVRGEDGLCDVNGLLKDAYETHSRSFSLQWEFASL